MNKPKNESHFYTIDQEISGYIVDSYGIDTKTAKGKLHKFVYYIYLCSFDQGNPMFHESTKKRTGFSSELIYIYELMSHYFKAVNAISFKNPLDNSASESELSGIDRFDMIPSFEWHVSEIDMPILALCIYTIPSKKNPPISEFLKSITDIATSDTWISTILNKEYFLLLENIYKKYAKKPAQQQIIRDAIAPITRMCINSYTLDDLPKLTQYSIYILRDYEYQLSRPYEYQTERQPKREAEIIKYFYDRLKSISTKLLTYIEKNQKDHLYHKNYPISIDNYDEFKEHSEQYILAINNLPDEFKKSLSDFFLALKFDSTIEAAIANNTLTYDFKESARHTEQITALFSRYTKYIADDFRKYFNKVRAVSHQTKYINHIPDPSIYPKLKRSIKLHLKHLYNRLAEEAASLPDLFVIHRKDPINNIRYSPDILSSDEFLKILKIVFPERDFDNLIIPEVYSCFLGKYLLHTDKAGIGLP